MIRLGRVFKKIPERLNVNNPERISGKGSNHARNPEGIQPLSGLRSQQCQLPELRFGVIYIQPLRGLYNEPRVNESQTIQFCQIYYPKYISNLRIWQENRYTCVQIQSPSPNTKYRKK